MVKVRDMSLLREDREYFLTLNVADFSFMAESFSRWQLKLVTTYL